MCISVCISSISSWVFFSTQWTNSHSLVSLLTEWKGQREERDKRVVYKVIPSRGSTYHQHSHSLSVANGFTAVPHYSEQANTEREEHSSALVVRQNNHMSSSVKSWRVWGNWVLNEPSWIENSWVTIVQNEMWVSSLHTASISSLFLSLSVFITPQRHVTCSEPGLHCAAPVQCPAVLIFCSWVKVNEWISEGMNERMERMNERWGKGRLRCYAVSPWHRPACFVLPSTPPCLLIGWEESMLLEGTAVMWGLLPSLSQPLQFMNESWKNWMKNWVACERVVCALPVLCSSGKICLALVLWMHFLCMLYTHNHGRHLTLNQGGKKKKHKKKKIFLGCSLCIKTIRYIATYCVNTAQWIILLILRGATRRLFCVGPCFLVIYLAFVQFIKHKEYFWLLIECVFV